MGNAHNFCLCMARTFLGVIFVFCEVAKAQQPFRADIVGESLVGSGTGFFVSSSGYFLTNYHVVKNAAKVRIRISDKVLDAKVVTVDIANDIAVLKVEGESPFPYLVLKTSADVSMGDDVFTIGFPNPELQGIGPKLTRGTISAAAGIQDDPRHFQVSIPVQPGNSGGPLLDESGAAVGIIDATLSPSAVIRSSGALPQNVNYAIKSAYVLPLLEGKIQQSQSQSREAKHTKHEIITNAETAVGLVLAYKSSVSGDRSEIPGMREKVAPPHVEKTPIKDRPAHDNDFARFLSQLRIAVHNHNTDALAPMMTEDFGYHLKPMRQGPGVFDYWDKIGAWNDVERILNEPFVPKGAFMVAPPQFVKADRYRGYRAGIMRINGRWYFAYFVKD